MFDEINDSLKWFWEIEILGIQQSKPEMMTREEKIAFEKVRHSLIHDGERYQVAVPWKSTSPVLPNNYEMALSRLGNTEKRLLEQSSVGDDYKSSPHSLKRVTFGRLTSLRDSPMMSGTSPFSGLPF